MLVLNQNGLIRNIFETVGMSDCNTQKLPTKVTPLGTNANRTHLKERWNYVSFIGILMYISSNAQPEIQFLVHQCGRFSHVPWANHEEAIKHICRYFLGVKGNGLTFQPNTILELDLYLDAYFSVLWNYEDNQDTFCVKSRPG